MVSTTCTKGFLSRIFLVPKKWFSKTTNKPIPAEPIYSLGAFQDGQHPLSGELNPGGGLNDKSGSKRCLLFHPNSPRTSSMAMLLVATSV